MDRAPLLLVVLAFACAKNGPPTAEFAAAQRAFDDAMDATFMDFTDPRFDSVLQALERVPTSNGDERKRADVLAGQIEDARRSKNTLQGRLDSVPTPKNEAMPVRRRVCYNDCERAVDEQLKKCGCQEAFGPNSQLADDDDIINVPCVGKKQKRDACVGAANQTLNQCRTGCDAEFR